ncbi:MAG: hypothetical protein UX75_C0022G0011 [Candidatus Moranbacteria bacterium GW2011_GWE2_47_10]|nr:MAG: hypothetical protein UX75_C0022G0011 [Candidatus Moranbacteria bacterium GW2011_GWE2_47_10]HBP01212.1 hypothetical protein [Candidatus Moranbacteria bacterium]
MEKHEIGNRLEAILALARDCIEETRRPLWEMNFKEFPFDLESERDWLANMETLNRLLSKFQLACKKLEESEFSDQEKDVLVKKADELMKDFPNRIAIKFKELLRDVVFCPKEGDWLRITSGSGYDRFMSGKVKAVDISKRRFTAECLLDRPVHDSPYQTQHLTQTLTFPFSSISEIIRNSISEHEDMLVKYREGYVSSI